MRIRLLASFLFLAFIVSVGFYTLEKRTVAEPVMVTLPGARITLLEKRADTETWRLIGEEIDVNKLPDLPEGYEPEWMEEGAHFSAVRGQRASWDEKHGDSRLWLFDKQWKLVGQVQGVRGGTWRQGPLIDFAWLGAGQTLGVVMHDRNKVKETLSVGVVDLPSLQWHEIYRKEGPWQIEYVWLKDELVAFFSTLKPERHSVVAVDFKTGKARTIFKDGKQQAFSSPFFSLVASPDKTRVAVAPNNLNPQGSSGIWLLDIRTGSFQELTREKQTGYDHAGPRWINNRELTFHRRDGEREAENWNLYRVTLPEGNGELKVENGE